MYIHRIELLNTSLKLLADKYNVGTAPDFPPKCGQKRCVKMEVLNLSMLP